MRPEMLKMLSDQMTQAVKDYTATAVARDVGPLKEEVQQLKRDVATLLELNADLERRLGERNSAGATSLRAVR